MKKSCNLPEYIINFFARPDFLDYTHIVESFYDTVKNRKIS